MEDQNNDQPQATNPARSRRKRLRWLAVPAAVAVLALVYQLARPPELVWWESQERLNNKGRIKLLVPSGWEMWRPKGVAPTPSDPNDSMYTLIPRDPWPRPLKRFLPKPVDGWLIQVKVRPLSDNELLKGDGQLGTMTIVKGIHLAHIERFNRIQKIGAWLAYSRVDLKAFNRTYKQICNSLTIE